MAMFNEFQQTYRRALAAKIEKAVWQYGRLAAFSGFIDTKKYSEAPVYGQTNLGMKPTGKICDIRRDFENVGSYQLDVPVIYPLSQQGVYGAQELRGSEEQRSVLTKKVSVNAVRHAVKIQDTIMSAIALKKPQIYAELMQRGTNDLSDWFGRKISFLMYQSVIKGASDNLTDSTYGIPKLAGVTSSHPNTYVRGVGKIPFTTAGAAFETAVASGLNNSAFTTVTSGVGFNLDCIRKMVVAANFHKVQPVETPYGPRHVIMAHPSQGLQLKADPNFIAIQQYAGPRVYQGDDENHLFSGMLDGIDVEGAYLMFDATIPSATSDGSTVTYGAFPTTYMANPRDTGSLKPALLLGAGAILGGYALALRFDEEYLDYKNFKGDGVTAVLGFQRADITDDDGFKVTAGNTYENTSSLVFWTNSPDVSSLTLL